MVYNSARDLFISKIGEVIEEEDIYIVSSDFAGVPFDYIREKYPDHYLSVGIAEQNMISVSAGIALEGKRAVAYAANPFIALRAFDQIRNGIGMMNLPVAVVGVGTGFSVSSCGSSHFTTEDFAIMSLCPGMRIITISDDSVSQKAFEYFLRQKQPTYYRFDKECCGVLGDCNDENFNNGFRFIRRNQSRNLLISIGYMTNVYYERNGEEDLLEIISVPFCEKKLLNTIEKYEKIYVLEEQQVRGGLGSLLIEKYSSHGLKIGIVGVDYGDKLPSEYGDRDYWLRRYELYNV